MVFGGEKMDWWTIKQPNSNRLMAEALKANIGIIAVVAYNLNQ